MARPRTAQTDEFEELNDLALAYLNEFGGGEESLTDGFKRAYTHARHKKNDEKGSVLFAMNHGMDDEFENPDA